MTNDYLALIILAFIIVSFATQKIPLAVTSVFGAIAMAAFKIISFSDAISSFGSDVVMMVAGMIVVGNALCETGFADCLGKKIISIKGVANNEKFFLAIVLVIVAICSAFMSNTATVAMFLPLVASVSRASKGTITKKNTYMAIGISSILGGNLTLAGSTPQMVVQGVLSQTEGCKPMGFFLLTKGAIPLVIIMILYFITIGYKLQLKIFDFTDNDIDTFKKDEDSIDSKKVIISGLIFLGCVIGFIFNIFTLGIVALIGAGLCIITGCISEKRAYMTMDWTSILVLGGALGFSKGLDKSGAMILLSDKLLSMVGGESANPVLVLGMIIVLCAVMGNVMSHTATAAVIAPLAIFMALRLGVNPTTFAVAVVIGCNLSFLTPVSTPPLTMTLIGGYKFIHYVRIGGLLNIILVIITVLILPILYGL